MNSRLLRTFWLVFVTMSFLASGLKASNPVFLGYGSDPQWSPSGKLICAWRGDTLVVFDVSAKKETKTIPVLRPKFLYWLTDDTLALSYQGETAATRPIDRWPILTRSIITVDGVYTVIRCDTVYDYRNCTTHWMQVPDGKVGIFRVESGLRTKFFSFESNSLRESPPDTARRAECWAKAPIDVTQFFPSHSCSMAVVYTADEFVDIVQTNGSQMIRVAPRGVRLPDGKTSITGKPKWSYDDRFVCFRRVVEDGHNQFGSEVILLDLHTRDQVSLSSTNSSLPLTFQWSSAGSDLIMSIPEEERLMLWQFGRE